MGWDGTGREGIAMKDYILYTADAMIFCSSDALQSRSLTRVRSYPSVGSWFMSSDIYHGDDTSIFFVLN